MTLDEFHKEEQSDLDRFYNYWTANHTKNPEMFPMQMEPGEWFEQFMAWSAIR